MNLLLIFEVCADTSIKLTDRMNFLTWNIVWKFFIPGRPFFYTIGQL